MSGAPQHADTHRTLSPLLASLVFVVAMCLRPALTSVGPLLPQIGPSEGLGETAQGLLGALPLLAFAAVSPVVHRLSQRLGVDRAVLVALLVLTAATVARSWTGHVGLWLGTFVIGGAIAVGNVLVPVIVRRDYADAVARSTGIYSACLVIAAGVASAVAVPLAAATDWRVALAVWAVPALLVAVAWLPRTRSVPDPHTASAPASSSAGGPGVLDGSEEGMPEAPGPHSSVWRQRVAWLVTAFMGLQACAFYVLVTWLPTLESTLGVSDRTAGLHLFLFQGVGIVGGLTIPVLLRRDSQVLGCVVASVPTLVAVLGLLVAPSLVVVWVLVAGFGQGAALVTALFLVSARGRSHHEATRLSGMAQSVGYLLAAVGPVAAGYLAERTGGWRLTLVLLALVAVAQIAVAVLVGRDRPALAGPVPVTAAGPS